MERLIRRISGLLWPNVSTEDGVFRARSVGAAALVAIAATYVHYFLSILGGSNLMGGTPNIDRMRTFALIALGMAIPATCYLAIRIWWRGCAIAAWMSFGWIGYKTLNAFLGITPANPLTLLIVLFASLQGVRACSLSLINHN
jgi:hypothetical protein